MPGRGIAGIRQDLRRSEDRFGRCDEVMLSGEENRSKDPKDREIDFGDGRIVLRIGVFERDGSIGAEAAAMDELQRADSGGGEVESRSVPPEVGAAEEARAADASGVALEPAVGEDRPDHGSPNL